MNKTDTRTDQPIILQLIHEMVQLDFAKNVLLVLVEVTETGFAFIREWLLLFIALVGISICIYLLWKPLNRVRGLADVGFQYVDDAYGRRLSPEARRNMVHEVRRRRDTGNCPPVYPNGWFPLAESDNVKREQAIPVEALGNNFAVFRDVSGVVHVLDAYCPHLGAHLGIAGIVRGDCLECPFHAWRFSGHDGKCKSIPYSEKVPEFAKVKHWLSHEANGFVFVWFHAEGDEPTWWPEPIPEIMNGKWPFRGRTEHYVNAHIQEIPENGSDLQHFAPVHEAFMFTGVDMRFMNKWFWRFARHSWNALWSADPPPNSHSATLHIHHAIKLWNKFCVLPMDVVVKQIGPAYVQLRFQTPLGVAILFQSLTPIEPLVQKMVHRIYSEPAVITPYAKIIIWSEAIMVERDIMMWNNKRYEDKPLLVKEDNLILRYRRWYSQFYSENSPRATFRKEGLEW